MTNGANTWGVQFSHIKWLESLLQAHDNVLNVSRHNDIIFEIDRQAQSDHLTLLCCNEYTMGLTLVHRALHEFGKLDIMYIGGGWCSYTKEAKGFCLKQQIGLYVTDEMSGALWKSAFWDYHKRDKDGNPEYHYGNG
ncbi:MAG TPA: hypothetical protein VHZ78_16075 [Rhizomicrobium sp.]|jgi:hypothetical protein|nr:hypothetical protein [Rhizomicrobium sp.]